jgi:hypothetical protein
MKTWLRILITCIEAAVVLTVVYFEPTHCVRGVLWREAFYEGKPTSYWRERIERWMAQYSSPEEALENMVLVQLVKGVPVGRPGEFNAFISGPQEVIIDSSTLVALRPPTPWERFRAAIWLGRGDGSLPMPGVLHGEMDAEPVLRELARDEKSRQVVERALNNAKAIRVIKGVDR